MLNQDFVIVIIEVFNNGQPWPDNYQSTGILAVCDNPDTAKKIINDRIDELLRLIAMGINEDCVSEGTIKRRVQQLRNGLVVNGYRVGFEENPDIYDQYYKTIVRYDNDGTRKSVLYRWKTYMEVVKTH